MESDYMEVESVDENGTCYFDDGTNITINEFIEQFREFLKRRVAGETLVPADMERFMQRTSSKNLKLLMQGKKQEGFMEAVQNKVLTPAQKMAIGGVAVIIVVIAVALVIAKSGGVF